MCVKWLKTDLSYYLLVADLEGKDWVVLAQHDGAWVYFTPNRQWLPMNPKNREGLLETIMYYKNYTGY